MVSKVMGIGLTGLEGYAVEIETDMRRSETDIIEIVGLPDTAVREAKNRIKTALSNSGFHLPDVFADAAGNSFGRGKDSAAFGKVGFPW